MRTVLIGDVHGCDAALRALLDKVGAAPPDTLVLLGDLFDRGPDAFRVFQTVLRLAERFGEGFTLLRGNHEDYLLAERLTMAEKRIWNRVGRQETVRSFRAHGRRMEDAAPWLREHCRLWWKGGDLQAVHAAVVRTPVEENDPWTLLHDHETVLRNEYDGPLTVVGHIALDYPVFFPGGENRPEPLQPSEWHPLPERGVICIDTGCGKGGRLTAMIVEEGRFRLESVSETGV